ncbi:hypothetical protein [Ohtaekwangia koreensis]|uniref:hypothetical protein n=1 Tax=Ohtaekwangia koreensis TaxID=688867 RepID=UPI001FE9C54F|nr:hypothetical protein [Ohtaekwangia koreensis]
MQYRCVIIVLNPVFAAQHPLIGSNKKLINERVRKKNNSPFLSALTFYTENIGGTGRKVSGDLSL